MTNLDLEYQAEVEGLDEGNSESWADYPLDTVFVRKDQRTVGEIITRIKKGRYKLDPEFQRDYVWNINQQVRLIESSLMRIPLPVLYVAEDVDGRIIVVDGLQRLTTFFKYINDEFSLKNIGSNDPDDLIRDKKFSQLPIHLQERIEDTQLTLYILDSKAPERARLDIFERVNSGVPLTRQQMRNCLYSGPATKFLKDASNSLPFIQAVTPAQSMKKTMRDREIINRFCAFYINSIDDYKGEMEDYLAEALLKINVMPQHDIDTMMIDFIKSMSLNFKIFGKNSFRKSIARNPNQRTVLNVSLFDTISTCFALNWSKLEKLDHIMLKDKLIFLLQYPPFYDSITLSTNNTYNIRYRHQLVNKVFGHDLDKTCVQNIIEFELSHFNTSIDNEMVESLVKCYENIAMSSAPFNERYSLFNNEFENIFMKYNFKYYPRNIFLLFECMFGEYKSSVDI
ncbi:TPA: DUF262 domain-containing protein [Acinetobacter baumannii]|uniref:DUF262 domain-containing protein n=3 Tax=Acinetobacter baumannii TaxID=470 RepID=UPI00344C6413|nr:DUF262 domain-containing protein [Acinetobacter baumannii]HAV5689226.1 DUF262 domain-containing protein [Acinetobacter baumannii]HAV5698404.1 DUF262 domain-containing protein [Acinetobacter baumannii]HAV5725577.1 DUF262 domain-containing protein [Acinetobacter baumannii]HAV5732184.1 DUF262 domain-containing protein [Acinetobacter baumannii]